VQIFFFFFFFLFFKFLTSFEFVQSGEKISALSKQHGVVAKIDSLAEKTTKVEGRTLDAVHTEHSEINPVFHLDYSPKAHPPQNNN
jgi:hypothetical protein